MASGVKRDPNDDVVSFNDRIAQSREAKLARMEKLRDAARKRATELMLSSCPDFGMWG